MRLGHAMGARFDLNSLREERVFYTWWSEASSSSEFAADPTHSIYYKARLLPDGLKHKAFN